MRRAAHTDKNQAEIVEALRGAGASVHPLHQVGAGVPDLLVGFRGTNYLLEVKTEQGTLTDDQADWILAWKGEACIVRTTLEALHAIGAIVE